jgi:hypothetical protein
MADIKFRFSDHNLRFPQFAKIQVGVNGGLKLILPVTAYVTKRESLFTVNAEIVVKSMEILQQMASHTAYEVEVFFNKFAPDINLLERLRFKAERILAEDEVVPETLTREGMFGEEFLQTDFGTLFYGNVEHNGHAGCIATVEKNPFYVGVTGGYELLEKAAKGCGYLILGNTDAMDTLEKVGYHRTVEMLRDTFKRVAGDWLEETAYKYRILLSGTDDYSLVKYFPTSHELRAEIKRLRRCQPLDMQIDILSAGYRENN